MELQEIGATIDRSCKSQELHGSGAAKLRSYTSQHLQESKPASVKWRGREGKGEGGGKGGRGP